MVSTRQKPFFSYFVFCFFLFFYSKNAYSGKIIKCLSLLQWPNQEEAVLGQHEFQPAHFAPAHFKSLGGNNLLKKTYSVWSAEVANRISPYIQNANLEAAFKEVAKARHRFEEETNPNGDFMLFGILKHAYSRNHDAYFGNMTLTPKEIFPEKSVEASSRRKYTEEVARLYADYLPAYEDMRGYREIHSATYIDGSVFPIKEFVIDIRPTYNQVLKAETVRFYSSSYGEGTSFKAFVLAKIRAAKALKAPNQDLAFKEFALSAYAYFGSMPYMRGSAAIGRVVYTVLAQKVFKKAIILDPEIDIRVLMRNEADFIAYLEQSFIEQGVELR